MRLARFVVDGSPQIFAARDGGWVPLSGTEGLHLTDLLDETRRSGIAEQLGAARASDLTLENAATVLDRGDIWATPRI